MGNKSSARAWRMLIVEDDPDAADILAMLLQTHGHETQIANTGEEAVAKALAFSPEVILLDIGLPKMDGYKACSAIRAQPFGGDVIIIALTGWGQRSAEASFNAYLLKPVRYADLMNTIASVIRAERVPLTSA